MQQQVHIGSLTRNKGELMSRKKLILSILLMIGMIVAGIVLPALWKAEKQKNHTADPNQPAKEIQTEGENTASLPTLKYVAFEELQAFFNVSKSSISLSSAILKKMMRSIIF